MSAWDIVSLVIAIDFVQILSEDHITVYFTLIYRYTRAERELKAARPYGEGAVQFYEKAEV